jgi:DNA-binding NtrC family response regulator
MTMPTEFKIFLVDDDAFSLALYEQTLRSLGCTQISTYNNGTDCLNALIEKPQVIFLDHNMDNLTGFEVLKKIKRFDPNIYVVMVSGQENMQQALDALRFGAFDYLIKGENETEKMQSVLTRIAQVQDLLKKKRPSFLNKLIAFL